LVDGKIVKEDEAQKEQKLALGKPFTFTLKGFDKARKVALAGDFNDWNPTEIFMSRTADGWSIPYVLGPGNYQYKFIVDGNWITDPANRNIVDDGNLNSFMVVEPNHTFRLKGFAGAKKINLAGTFNNWSPEGLAMKRVGDEWVGSVYLGRGKHLYKFVVDGKWIRDPANPFWEDDNDNNVVWVE
jgi:1,4-alpha-glucan branching enzyme